MLIGAQHLRGLEARYAQHQNPSSQAMAPVAIMGPSQAPNGGMSNVAMVSNDEGFMSGALNGDDWQPAQIEDEAMMITPDNNPQAFAIGVLQREAAMNKENIAVNHQYAMPPPASTHRQALGPRKLIDRQPNAQRVEWEDPAFSQDVASNSAGTKRDHATAIEGDDMEIDPSQDEGFQQDDRSQIFQRSVGQSLLEGQRKLLSNERLEKGAIVKRRGKRKARRKARPTMMILLPLSTITMRVAVPHLRRSMFIKPAMTLLLQSRLLSRRRYRSALPGPMKKPRLF